MHYLIGIIIIIAECNCYVMFCDFKSVKVGKRRLGSATALLAESDYP